MIYLVLLDRMEQNYLPVGSCVSFRRCRPYCVHKAAAAVSRPTALSQKLKEAGGMMRPSPLSTTYLCRFSHLLPSFGYSHALEQYLGVMENQVHQNDQNQNWRCPVALDSSAADACADALTVVDLRVHETPAFVGAASVGVAAFHIAAAVAGVVTFDVDELSAACSLGSVWERHKDNAVAFQWTLQTHTLAFQYISFDWALEFLGTEQ